MALLDIKYKNLLCQFNFSEQGFNKEQSSQHSQSEHEPNFHVLFYEERATDLVSVDLLSIFLLVHVNVIYLNVLKHVYASLLLHKGHHLRQRDPVSVCVIAYLLNFTPVQRLILDPSHYIDQIIRTIFRIFFQLISYLPRSLLLSHHYVKVENMVEHVLHIAFENCLVLLV